jgi:four helix bundle protein
VTGPGGCRPAPARRPPPAAWPRDELFGSTNQIRRAAVSIPANIAEGKGRTGSRELLHHLSIAHGSLCEVETHLLIAGRRNYLDQAGIDQVLDLLSEVGRLLRCLIKRFRDATPPL